MSPLKPTRTWKTPPFFLLSDHQELKSMKGMLVLENEELKFMIHLDSGIEGVSSMRGNILRTRDWGQLR